MPLPHDAIVARIEKHCKQLEGLEHQTSKRDLGLQLVGHIREAIACADIADTWQARVTKAFKKVTEPVPEIPDIQDDMPPAVDAAAANAATVNGVPAEQEEKTPGGMIPQTDPPPSVKI